MFVLNPQKSELFTKQACKDAVVVYALFFSPTTYTSLYSLSTVLRISNFTLCTHILYIYIEITSWKVRAYGFYSRVEKYRKTNE